MAGGKHEEIIFRHWTAGSEDCNCWEKENSWDESHDCSGSLQEARDQVDITIFDCLHEVTTE